MNAIGSIARRPDFFIVGAPKCGTTSMDYYLGQHPEVFMAEKEPHYFARDLIPDCDRLTEDGYFALFATPGPAKRLGEASVFYMYSKVAAREIHTFDPEAKIIVHIRNPVDALASHHSQLLYNGLETIDDLEEALSVEEKRKRGEHLPEKTGIGYGRPEYLYYREVVSFSEQIDRYLALFGPDRVHFVVFDDLKADLGGVYRRTLEFLKVAPDFEPRFDIENANKRIRSQWVRDFVRRPPEWASQVSRALMPAELRTAVKGRLRTLNTEFVPRPPMSPELRRRLQAEFAPEVDRLSALLDRDLSHWSAPAKQ